DKGQVRSKVEHIDNQKVISYYTASRKQLDNFERSSNMIQDDTIRKRKLSNIKQLWFSMFVGFAVICLVGYLFTLGDTPYISLIGTAYRQKTDYQKIVSEVFGKDIRNQLKPLLQSNTLESEISKALPEAQSVIVKSSIIGHKPEVKVTLAEPMAVFAQNNSKNYILSNRGRVLLLTSQTDINTTLLPIIANQSGVEAKAGGQFLRPDEATALNSLIFQYEKNGIKGVIYTINNIPHEVLVKEPGRGYQVRYLLDETIGTQYGAMIATQKKLIELGNSPALYIDVRLIEKVYYK
ncbi:MAG: hypothetical protein WCP03_03795, partial [Candidatus Saccharibacteria bacterium]